MNHDDEIFVRNFALVLVGLFVIALLATMLAKFVNSGAQASRNRGDVAAIHITPIGQVNTGTESIDVASLHPVEPVAVQEPEAEPVATAQAPAGGNPGKTVYDSLCFTCHAQGIAGAPKFGDMAAWESRVEKGFDTNLANSINGFTGSSGLMPPKGGNPALSDEEIAAAVEYMLAAVGGGNGPSTTSGPAPAPEPEAMAEAPAAAENDRGKEVYDAACFVCHAPGAAGAPRFGDATAWANRIEKGIDALYHNSIKGYMGDFGVMPPKGGRPDFSDDDVKAAVDYMVSNAQ
jgi:cytochrome c5